MQEITQELIQSLFNYHGGNLYRKIYKSSNAKTGDKVGSLNTNGYYQVRVNSKKYLLHRLIFLYHRGYLPEFLDHIDQNPLNNNIENLRETTRSQNGMNRKSYKNSSSIYKGVAWHKRDKKWGAQIVINGKSIHLGCFINESDAAIAYNKAAIKYFGEYAKLNEV